MTSSTRAEARELCAKLLPHTTSMENVDLVAEALAAAEERGRQLGLHEAEAICEQRGMEFLASLIHASSLKQPKPEGK